MRNFFKISASGTHHPPSSCLRLFTWSPPLVCRTIFKFIYSRISHQWYYPEKTKFWTDNCFLGDYLAWLVLSSYHVTRMNVFKAANPFIHSLVINLLTDGRKVILTIVAKTKTTTWKSSTSQNPRKSLILWQEKLANLVARDRKSPISLSPILFLAALEKGPCIFKSAYPVGPDLAGVHFLLVKFLMGYEFICRIFYGV